MGRSRAAQEIVKKGAKNSLFECISKTKYYTELITLMTLFNGELIPYTFQQLKQQATVQHTIDALGQQSLVQPNCVLAEVSQPRQSRQHNGIQTNITTSNASNVFNRLEIKYYVWSCLLWQLVVLSEVLDEYDSFLLKSNAHKLPPAGFGTLSNTLPDTFELRRRAFSSMLLLVLSPCVEKWVAK